MKYGMVTLISILVCTMCLLVLTSCLTNGPANIRLDEDVLRTSCRRLSSSSSEDAFNTSSRRFDRDEYVRLSLTSSEDVFKTSWSRRIYLSWPYVFKTSSRRFQDVFKTSGQDVFTTFSRRLAKASSRHLQDVFKTYYQVKVFLVTQFQSSRRIQNVSKMYC